MVKFYLYVLNDFRFKAYDLILAGWLERISGSFQVGKWSGRTVGDSK